MERSLFQDESLWLTVRHDRFECRIDDLGEFYSLHVEPDFTRNNPAHIEQIFDELGLQANVSVNDINPFRDCLRIAGIQFV